MVAAGYQIADLKPGRSIVIAGLNSPHCWVFDGYMGALRKMAVLVEGNDGAGVHPPVEIGRMLV